MASSTPRVITNIHLAEFIQHVLGNDAHLSTVIICNGKERFVEDLLAACVEPSTNTSDDQPAEPNINDAMEDEPPTETKNDLLQKPTLLQLARSRTVKLVFCHDITHLRAYLATLATPKLPVPQLDPDESNEQRHASNNLARPQLALLNPIALHRFTTAFSAQGLNRTFSLAVEAAHATHRQLLMVECPVSSQRRGSELVDAEHDFELAADPAPLLSSPWDEEVSLLNVTTKSFGAGGRGWVGRTVTIRRIAERWCTFATLPRHGTHA